jgi:hypothetical protein
LGGRVERNRLTQSRKKTFACKPEIWGGSWYLGLDLKNASPFPVTALIELANGYGGYVPTRVDYDLGGYEIHRHKAGGIRGFSPAAPLWPCNACARSYSYRVFLETSS